MSEKRSSFSGKLGFVLATAGSAVGLGNIWRFPYLTAKYGGGIFLLVYFVLVITFGFALSCAEILIGRKTGKSAIEAFSTLNKKWSFVGWLAALVPVIILPYYSVIGGWIIKYLVAYSTGGAKAAADSNYFSNYMGQITQPIGWFLLFLALTAVVVLLGVEKGIEKVSKILMPALVILIIFIAIYTICMPGAIEGVKYYLVPDFSQFSATTVLGAMGQLFYSMSLAMGIMITYGSYMKKDVSVSSAVHQVEIFDTGIAFLAGLMVVPAVFAFSGAENINKGAGLMFMTLPKVFDKMPGGAIIGLLFFIMVLFAALTSSISLMETVVSFVCDRTKLNRKLACLLVFLLCIVLGIPSALGNGVTGVWDSVKLLGFSFLDFFDFISNSVLMPIVALLTCIFVGYVIKPKALIEEAELSGKFSGKRLFTIVIRYIAPICIVLILVFSVREALGYTKV
ncbi:MAG: sodium-dependent transporter [Ruminococcaceae bacterium]|nr:sodium-dependent transporter [Oscillospiraceae bacterium]